MSVLKGPKKTAAGYFLALNPPVEAPELHWDDGQWTLTDTWTSWAEAQRESLLGEMLSHGSWFSKPPRRDILSPIFGPWSGTNMQKVAIFLCKTPDVPGSKSGRATWSLEGLIMSSISIVPVWKITNVHPDPEEDQISLFGGASTVDVSDDDGIDSKEGGETREILFDEIEEGPPAAPTRIRNREWEARKFLAKERVRESRLKAQIATRLAEKEESRFYAQFGELDDGDSHFSEYDLTDEEPSDDESVTA